ncbi:valine--tRNA ligase [Paracrocinitomix mangrovi]|uniref:valine--tRNA ligase n=1 Tax=Paracrocinitomix mangrovi TaxID=2862509 RepID=UPI001C8DCF9F|nr:valine--tRNA ligase [Paracrocinitomix mangrovi]UKN03045.1 valine--tRNA ligase [Paracrocinitomix mangrovi]
MEIPKQYDPSKSEDKWYKHWMNQRYFHSEPDNREPYTIVIPPPNVTGVLHMGHMLNNTIQDVLVRKARMEGKNACWVPGTDHASIATEAKVVKKLRDEGIKKSDLSRDEFLKHAMDWKDKYGGVILEQLKKLGASCDWDRTNFTMNPEYSESVIDTFIDLYKKGKIYRGLRMINWDPQAQTALSDEEVEYKEVNSKLYHVRYKIEGSEDEWLTIATTRPETILGDTAICVNPNDARYANLVGKKAIVPIADRAVPIIQDEYVDMEFGTGCLKITPAHDENDYGLGQKHKLETIDILNDDGSLNEHGLHYSGKDRFEVRTQIAKELDERGYMIKIEDHINKVGYSERTNAVIEPKLSLQWFVNMKELSKPALDVVMNGEIKFHPDNMKNTYRHWMENIKDWCISRQLWWGHQIPAWYFGSGPNDYVVARTAEEAAKLASEKTGKEVIKEALKQDEDVLDTWFSSWLWPISTFDATIIRNGKEAANADLKYYYPTNDLVTAPEIMFFWVARMIIAGIEYLGEVPFKNVYYTGIVRDKLGRKMSKSLGNSPDPIELMEEYGADGVRVGILISSPAGNDLPFDTSQCEQGRNFANKIWNALRLVNMWEWKDIEQPEASKLAIEWFESRLNQTIASVNNLMDKFRISEALMTIYKFAWDDFCNWYLEMIKPEYQHPIDTATLDKTIEFFEQVVKLAHPFMPHLTEEIWHWLKDREEGEDIIISKWPTANNINEDILKEFEVASSVVTNIRNIRKQKNIANKVEIELSIKINADYSKKFDPVINKMGNISKLAYVEEKVANAFSFIEKNNEYFIPFGETVDVGAEKKKIEEELEYAKGSLAIVQKKLSNDKFVNNAPDQVVAMERKKEADAISKIQILEDKLAELN